jgi:hypothetical protein
MAFVACGSRTFIQNTYATMYIAGTTYDTAMKTISALQAQGKITQAQRDEVNKYANQFYVAYHSAVDAFATYQKTSSAADQDKLNVALAGIVSTWATLAANVNRLVPNALSPTLPK